MRQLEPSRKTAILDSNCVHTPIDIATKIYCIYDYTFLELGTLSDYKLIKYLFKNCELKRLCFQESFANILQSIYAIQGKFCNVGTKYKTT